MSRRKKTPTGGTVGADAAQVAAVQPITNEYSTRRGEKQPPRAVGLPLDLSRQLDCCLYLEETITDPLTRRFAAILRRRLEESIPADGGRP